MATEFYYTPQILRESAEGINRFDIRDEMLDQRELELMTSVNAESCAVVIRDLLYLQREDPTTPITLYINSPGGEVQSGLALYDVMQAVSCPIRTVCLGIAASMAALLFIAGDDREILPHSRVMIHDPLISAGAGGNALSVKARADDLMRIRDIILLALSHVTAVCLSTAFSSLRPPIPISRRKRPSKRVLPTASSRSSRDSAVLIAAAMRPSRVMGISISSASGRKPNPQRAR